MDDFIVVKKVKLLDGEELMDLPRKIMAELSKQKAKLKRSLFLTHVFEDHIVVRDFETRKQFRLALSRADSGDIQLGTLEEVRTAFVPVKQKTVKAEDTDQIEFSITPLEECDSTIIMVKGAAIDEPMQGTIVDVILQHIEGAEPEEVIKVENNFWKGTFALK